MRSMARAQTTRISLGNQQQVCVAAVSPDRGPGPIDVVRHRGKVKKWQSIFQRPERCFAGARMARRGFNPHPGVLNVAKLEAFHEHGRPSF